MGKDVSESGTAAATGPDASHWLDGQRRHPVKPITAEIPYPDGGRAARSAANLAPLPRLIRMRDAPAYLGMDKNRFNREVRQTLTVIPIGTQGLAFDRVDLDDWADEYKSRNGRPAAARSNPWDKRERPASSNVVGSGMSINASRDTDDFAKVLAQAISKKRRISSTGDCRNCERSECSADAKTGRSEKRRRNT